MDGDLPTVILSLFILKRYRFELAFQCHWFEVNQHPVAEVIHILLKSGQSASREEVVEKRNVCRYAELMISIDMDARMRAEHIL